MSTPILEDQEMYLKVLYEAHLIDSELPIRTNQVAEAMSVTAASASEMLKRLGTKGFVDHVPYKGVTLTGKGIEAASRVKRREALMEVFLVEMLDFNGDIKDVACRLEHALTDELELAIKQELNELIEDEYCPLWSLDVDISRSKAIDTAKQTLENVYGADVSEYKISTNNWDKVGF